MNASESKTLKDSEVQREVDSLGLGTIIRKLRQRRSMTLLISIPVKNFFISRKGI